MAVKRLLTRVAPSLVVLGACGAGLHTLAGASWEELRKAVQVVRALAREQLRSEALDARCQLILSRMHERDAVCTDLAAGRLSLLQAATRFREVHQRAVPGIVEYGTSYPGNSEGERLCREVIDYTVFLFAEQPERCAALEVRLTAELQAHLDRSETITLP
jgi:hypothetical protein